ncbi:MAG: hypothetical protein ABII25_03665 [bacterium]
MKRNKIILFSLTVVLTIVFINSIHAFWLVQPKDASALYGQSVMIVGDLGYRKVNEKNGKELVSYGEYQMDEIISGTGSNINLKTRRVYLQGAGKIGEYVTLFARVLIPTTEIDSIDFGYIPYSPYPYLWGGGLGIQLLFPEFNKYFYGGSSLSWDWNGGIQRNTHTYPSEKLSTDFTTARRRDEINWRETDFAGWLAYRYKTIDIYGGISYIKTTIFLELGNENQMNYVLDKNIGGFAGAQISLHKRLSIGIESHFVNEYVNSLNIKYQF